MRLNRKKCAIVDICISRQENPESSDADIGWCYHAASQHRQAARYFIQSNLKWIHTSPLEPTAACIFYWSSKIYSLLTNDLVTIYKSFYRPILEYAAPV